VTPIVFASHRQLPRSGLHKAGRGAWATVALLCFWATHLPQARGDDHAPTVVVSEPATGSAETTVAPPIAPGLDLKASGPDTQPPTILKRWWFWTAVGAVAAATVVTIVMSSRGSAPPATSLGNQEFAP
jgi:hypothetical protein